MTLSFKSGDDFDGGKLIDSCEPSNDFYTFFMERDRETERQRQRN